MNSAFARGLRVARERNGWSIGHLVFAGELNIAWIAYVKAIESGMVEPTKSEMDILAAVIGLDVETIKELGAEIE